MADMAIVFENDEEMQRYWLDWHRSVEIGVFDRIDAIKAFRDGRADLLVPDNGMWRAYRVTEQYEAHRAGVRTMTARLRRTLLNSSIA